MYAASEAKYRQRQLSTDDGSERQSDSQPRFAARLRCDFGGAELNGFVAKESMGVDSASGMRRESWLVRESAGSHLGADSC